MNARHFFSSTSGWLVIAVIALVSVGTFVVIANREPASMRVATADRELSASGTPAPNQLAPDGSGSPEGAPPVSVDKSMGPDGTVASPTLTAPVTASSRGATTAPVSGDQREPGRAIAPEPPTAAAGPAASAPVVREFTLPAGTQLRIRLGNSLSTASAKVEDPVNGTLENSIVEDGVTVVPAGSAVSGQVVESVRSGKVKGRGRLSLRFTALRPEGDDTYRIRTRTWTKVAEGQAKKDAATIGIPAAGGAIVGGIIGGKKGAVIGGATGGGAGTAVVLTQRGPDVRLGAGAVVAVRLAEPVTVRVR